MNLNIKNKLALVTGSTAGIGYAIAERLLEEGASVVVSGRSLERVAQAKAELIQSHPKSNVLGFVGDLTTQEAQTQLFAEFKSLDILINNLGTFESKPLAEITPKDWTRMFETNVLSGAIISQHYLPGMLKRNEGSILFISSETAVNIPVDMVHYAVSKAAQLALARGFAEATRGTKVTVNSILPGPTLTEGVTKFLDSINADEREFILKLRPTSLSQRFAKPEEVANLAVYLVSPLASATNGASVRVEGDCLEMSCRPAVWPPLGLFKQLQILSIPFGFQLFHRNES